MDDQATLVMSPSLQSGEGASWFRCFVCHAVVPAHIWTNVEADRLRKAGPRGAVCIQCDPGIGFAMTLAAWGRDAA